MGRSSSDPLISLSQLPVFTFQGEGVWAGTPMVFIRFAYCNRHCAFCDTDLGEHYYRRVSEVVGLAEEWPAKRVCVTGGEPTLNLPGLFSLTHELVYAGFRVHLETNGDNRVPGGFPISWWTVSPKTNWRRGVKRCNEVKVVLRAGERPPRIDELPRAEHYWLVPCDDGSLDRNIAWCVKLLRDEELAWHWRLGLQAQKVWGVP